MTYHGTVSPGGPPDVRELTDLVITKLAVSDMNNNVYLLRCRHTGEQVVIDAADDATTILSTAGEGGVSRVVTTHRHWDHHRALAEVVAATERGDGGGRGRRRRAAGAGRPPGPRR